MITIEPPRSSPVPTQPKLWLAWELSRPAIARFATRAQAAVGLPGEVQILLASDATLRRLNCEYRNQDKSTDVLSFPAPEGFGTTHAGDLAISLPTARRQAAAHGHTLADELRILLLHGLLHLAGFDHETDAGEMAAREFELRHRLKLPSTLIDRAHAPLNRVSKPLKASKPALKAVRKPVLA